GGGELQYPRVIEPQAARLVLAASALEIAEVGEAKIEEDRFARYAAGVRQETLPPRAALGSQALASAAFLAVADLATRDVLIREHGRAHACVLLGPPQ